VSGRRCDVGEEGMETMFTDFDHAARAAYEERTSR
jgi:hypothetical protein